MGTLKKAMTSDGNAVIAVLDATDAVEESLQRLDAFPPSMAHLGQAMMGASLTHSLWNDKGQVKRVSLQWKVDGPFGHLFAESNEDGSVRGTILNAQAPVDNYETSLGQGHLQVRKDVGNDVTGIIEAKGSISDDLLEYLAQSEQRSCTISLSVKIAWRDEKKEKIKIDYALGYLIDVLPQRDVVESQNELKRWDDYLASLGPISEWQLPVDNRLDFMFQLLHPNSPVKPLMFQRVAFACNCSEERASRAAKLSEKMAPESARSGPLSVQCEFCGKLYRLD